MSFWPLVGIKKRKNMNQIIKVEKIRFYYSLIFLWHKEKGMETVERMRKNRNDDERNRDYIEEYIGIIENLPIPSEANIEEMALIARKVRSGILEWNYGEKYILDIPLGQIARTISELIENINAPEEMIDDSSPIKVFDRLIKEKEDYLSIATEVYNSFNVNNEKNLGGRIALVDTNWEFQKESNNDVTIFRNLNELNFESVKDAENIFNLAKEGKISILSIKIK